MNNRTWKNIRHAEGRARRMARLLVVGMFGLGLASAAQAGPREQAKRIHDRLAGVPPTEAVLQTMEGQVDPGQPGTAIDAAYTAMGNSNFYNVTLKNWAAPWTNRTQSVFVPLNDYIATVVGMIRDDVPFNTLLSANLIYVGDASLSLPAYSNANNAHYEELENRSLDMQAGLQQQLQSNVTGLSGQCYGGRHDHTRGIRSVFCRRHEPRDVPFHDAQSHV